MTARYVIICPDRRDPRVMQAFDEIEEAGQEAEIVERAGSRLRYTWGGVDLGGPFAFRRHLREIAAAR